MRSIPSGYNEPEGGFLENTVDALFGTDLTGTNPDTVEAYADNTNIEADGGVAITATDTADITADVSNSALAIPPFLAGNVGELSPASGPGISVGATIALNAVDTSVQAYVTQTGSADSVTAAGGDIDIAASDAATVSSIVVTPVFKLSVNFGQSAASSIGVSIARNIIDSNVSAYDGGRNIGTTQNPVYDNGLNLNHRRQRQHHRKRCIEHHRDLGGGGGCARDWPVGHRRLCRRRCSRHQFYRRQRHRQRAGRGARGIRRRCRQCDDHGNR